MTYLRSVKWNVDLAQKRFYLWSLFEVRWEWCALQRAQVWDLHRPRQDDVCRPPCLLRKRGHWCSNRCSDSLWFGKSLIKWISWKAIPNAPFERRRKERTIKWMVNLINNQLGSSWRSFWSAPGSHSDWVPVDRSYWEINDLNLLFSRWELFSTRPPEQTFADWGVDYLKEDSCDSTPISIFRSVSLVSIFHHPKTIDLGKDNRAGNRGHSGHSEPSRSVQRIRKDAWRFEQNGPRNLFLALWLEPVQFHPKHKMYLSFEKLLLILTGEGQSVTASLFSKLGYSP